MDKNQQELIYIHTSIHQWLWTIRAQKQDFEKNQKVPQKSLVIKNGQKSSDVFETLTQNSFRSYDLNEPKKSGLFRFFDGEKAKKHFSRKLSKVTNKNAPRKKSALNK